ncbi:MAG: carbohydrate ABC transporter permease [Alphaproteobacteria bacterium]
MAKRNAIHHKGYYFIAPFFIMFILFGLFPILYTLYLSFTFSDGWGFEFVGLENYIRLVTNDPRFLRAIKNTWIIWSLNFIPQLGSALFLAWVYTYAKIKGVAFFRAVFYFPNLVTATSVAVLFAMFLDRDSGILNQVLLSIGLIKEPIYFATKPFFMQVTVASIQWWMWFGHSTIILLAGMTAIPNDYFEAARVDGVKNTQIFWRITIPLLWPTIVYILTTSVIGGMQIFDIPYLLTRPVGSPQDSMLTLVVYLYQTAFSSQILGYGAAIAWAIFVIILGIILLSVFLRALFKIIRGDKRYA